MANNTPIATQEDGSNLIPKCIGFGSANQDAFTTAEKSTIPKNNEMIYPAINYMAGGASNESYGSWENWLVAIITLCIVTALNHYGKGIWKLASILIGIIAGYIISLFFVGKSN